MEDNSKLIKLASLAHSENVPPTENTQFAKIIIKYKKFTMTTNWLIGEPNIPSTDRKQSLVFKRSNISLKIDIEHKHKCFLISSTKHYIKYATYAQTLAYDWVTQQCQAHIHEQISAPQSPFRLYDLQYCVWPCCCYLMVGWPFSVVLNYYWRRYC